MIAPKFILTGGLALATVGLFAISLMPKSSLVEAEFKEASSDSFFESQLASQKVSWKDLFTENDDATATSDINTVERRVDETSEDAKSGDMIDSVFAQLAPAALSEGEQMTPLMTSLTEDAQAGGLLAGSKFPKPKAFSPLGAAQSDGVSSPATIENTLASYDRGSVGSSASVSGTSGSALASSDYASNILDGLNKGDSAGDVTAVEDVADATDDVTADDADTPTPVPLPASGLLLLAACGGSAAWKRRRS